MMDNRIRSRRAVLGLATAVLVATPALGFAAGSLAALSQLERGRWRIIDSDGGERHSVCIGDPMQLMRLEHRRASCSHELISADASGGTVQYSCPGRGFGHSHIRVETPRLARIDTQGLLDGRPFAYRAEAKRAGSC